MRTRSSLGIALFALAALPGLARADKLDKDDKKWLDDVRPILLADEEKHFKDLKDKADRLEFQKIFWAPSRPRPRDARERVPGCSTRRTHAEADTHSACRPRPAPTRTAAASSSCSGSRTRS